MTDYHFSRSERGTFSHPQDSLKGFEEIPITTINDKSGIEHAKYDIKDSQRNDLAQANS